ncbi:23S rRNA m(5)U-1939 methyltransferase [Pelagirhabdus alkalitolerans]|uniref:23S rRNA m(5)U-1939 methyltransferase n=1 Tax=Pelagirhabdus alkalitolerans TaxID=1612202 RepID=A0A1G6IR77_9BACI|nr:23S rRNA (uracil(1939)-C(5))-methyltransferase RlmD [Pelagirhabdus alkalitolerans]SDC08984.1 23S rRNA m(5)U-1939 methyltransferase [Pelagirhabdus alkalitolerans]
MAKPKAPVQKNQMIELTFEDMTHEGNGVGKLDGYPVFVENTLPGEKAQVKIIKVKKNFAVGKLIELQDVHPERIDPPCDVYKLCGGCQLQHMSYTMQLNMKHKTVKDNLRKIGHIEIEPNPTIGMEDPWRYRNKVQIPVSSKNGELTTGFYKKRSHEIIDTMDRCIITSEVNDRMVEAVRKIANDLGITSYDEKSHRGMLRHIVVRSSETTDQTMIVIVTRTKDLPHKKKLIKQLTETYPNIKSIMHNVNPNRTNVIMGKETTCLWGEDYIYDTMDGIHFAISAKSFYQVNSDQTKVLYDKALEYAGLTGKETVIDAYCGIGTISLFLAKKAKHVYGVEVVPEAIEDAKKNAELNQIENADFYVGQAEDVMTQWSEGGFTPDVIVVDPPRKGCDEALLDSMIKMNPDRIVYVSCNPSTLARDLAILKEGSYQIDKVQPVDMFPQTHHVENVVLMSRENK